MTKKLINSYLDKKNNKLLSNIVTKILISIMIVLISLIYVKNSSENKLKYKSLFLEDSMPFMNFKNLYSKISGISLKKEQLVMSEVFSYNKKEKYKDGENYYLDSNIINSISGGIVVYIGQKDDYNKCVIIQGSDGYDIWYCNLENVNVGIYDYVEPQKIIGDVNEYLTLIISKDKKYYSYEEYIH